MPDTLNKQALVNLLIDSPLREPIKINLIDIVNNTSETDLPKVYATITKELEIFQKATERRMKLAEETITKLGGTLSSEAQTPNVAPQSEVGQLPPLPTPPSPAPVQAAAPSSEGLAVPPLDLPPLPTSPTPLPAPEPLDTALPSAPTPSSSATDEDALTEIQKELDSLKTADALPTAPPATPAPTPPPAPLA